MKKRVWNISLIIILIVAVTAGVCGAQETKQLQIKPAGASSGDFDVAFKPVKKVFEVGEPIKFRIQGNQRFFLYLFSIDRENNTGTLVWPNELHKGNMYEANTEFMVPTSRQVEFYSGRPGVEKIIMVASTKWLDINAGIFIKKGRFYSADAISTQEVAKDLSIRAVEKKATAVTKEIDLVIAGPEPAASILELNGVVAPFISTDRTNYRIGDEITIIYGADKPGYVYLFSLEPGRDPQLLKNRKVTGETFCREKGLATPPEGEQQLMAVYDHRGNLTADHFQLIDPANPSKGLAITAKNQGTKTGGDVDKGIVLIDPKPVPFAIYQFSIGE